MFHPERGSDINCYKYYNSNTYNPIITQSGDSNPSKTIKNSHSFKKTENNYENKFIINKFLKKNVYNNYSYMKNSKLNQKIKIQINENKFNSFKKVPNKTKIKNQEIGTDELFYVILLENIY